MAMDRYYQTTQAATVPVKQKKGVCCPQCQDEMQLYLLRIGTRLITQSQTI
jgi:predicted  nucleic acid-binding Zn ribbon protein